ncbi:MAG: von Willebrand factor, type [Hydrocarboniphaga sp.]|uniref:nitric oxide reductase activation protein NorD n=1 Tax=Hydrocarboniphaga sp. TaxID=2033016 RepID=UPI0026202CFE|nr:VWA domain-containing protein [Hydrocarboniphaga sp.]MDB5968342.1 von Willebrand factor, type [Hydrocarboniphaga sp.]
MIDASRYLFLACAVAGRRVAVHVSSGSETLASSDGQAILLPSTVLQDDAGDEQRTWKQVVAQAALIGAGSLQLQLLRRLVGRPDAARRYACLEVLRASRLLAARMPTAFLDLPELRHEHAPPQNAADSLSWALSRRPVPESPAYFGTVRPLMALRKAISEEGWSALTQQQARGEFQHKQPQRQFDDDDATEESALLRLFQNPFAAGNAMAELLNKILGAGTSKGGREKKAGEGAGAELPVGSIERALRRGVHAVLARLPFEVPDIDARGESAGLRYPEWDIHQKKYRPDWAMVEEVEAWRPEGARDLGEVLKPAGHELKRQLGSLGLDHQMHRRQQDGAELDVGRLLDAAIDLATGHSPPSLDVYRASRRTRRDLAIVVGLDISGSTGERSGAGVSVFDRQLQLAYRLGRTLNDLGDTVAMFGFHSWGRNLVRSVRLKGPEERWSACVAERFAQLEPVGYTRTGAAIRHGARMLRTDMRLPNRLLILITDGIAYDQDYETAYAQGDARKALEEARAAGTACVCICVGGSSDADQLRAVFGAANLLIVDEPQQVTTSIRRVCRQALGAVSQRRLQSSTARASR